MLKLFLSVILCFASLSLISQKAVFYEEQREMRTYPYGDPDPVPRPGKIYPYFRFDSFAVDPVQREWNMVIMENEWIKLWLAPEIGGKVYGALDKKTGKAFIYHNSVVKFRDIAMRGPWTSGGIEINFGSIGHAPTTAGTVDYFTRINPDSSVSCFVGALDLPSRTEWRTEIYLPPDKAWFETRATWVNPSTQSTSLYHWMNASADVADDLRFYFPGTNYIDHSGKLFPWPTDKNGRDISLYRNNNFGGDHSYHILGKYTDWFGGYYEKSDYGFGHFSLYPIKAGKKIWMWALSRQGAIWENLLTDTAFNGQYTEIQTGLLYNQAGQSSTYSPFKHLEFEPGSEISFVDRWFPVSDISGLKHISDLFALNITEQEKGKKLLLYSLAYITDTLDIITESGYQVSRPLSLMPADTLSIDVDSEDDISKIFLRFKGLEIYKGDDRAYALERPLESEHFEWASVYGLYYQAMEYSRQRDYAKAENYLRRCIEEDPYFMPAYAKLAELQIRKFKYDEAEMLAKKVLAFDAYDPTANIIYAGLLEKKGDLKRAADAYGMAMLSSGFYNLCINNLALLSIRGNELYKAKEYLDHAAGAGINTRQLKLTKLVWARKAGYDSLFTATYKDITDLDPLNHFARFENYLLNENDSLEYEFTRYIRNEFSAQTYLEMACRYINLEIFDEAYSLLELSPSDPLVSLYLAYLADMLGENDLSDQHLDTLLNSGIDFVFPFRAETEHILNWAAGRTGSWKMNYYRALIYWNAGDMEKARHFFSLDSNEADAWQYYIARGDFFQAADDLAAERDYREAFRMAASEWRTNHKLVTFYLSKGFTSRALELSGEAYKKFRGNYIIEFDHARSLLARDSIYRCIDVLKEIVLLPHEGAWQGRDLWKKANILASLDNYWYGRIDEAAQYIEDAYKWPENLGVGKPYRVDERLPDFVRAMVIIKKGETDEARDLYERIIRICTDEYDCIDSYNILKVFALRELNRERESDNYFKEWIGGLEDKRVKQWALSLYEGRFEEAEEYAYMVPDLPDTEPWEESPDITDLSLLHQVVKKYLQEKW
ncbi:MAG: DUF5107 domain-containing protein [Bacteroidales bacterium]|nr:DUF5107 domain-containing protein [Bacteroidales bacterium]